MDFIAASNRPRRSSSWPAVPLVLAVGTALLWGLIEVCALTRARWRKAG